MNKKQINIYTDGSSRGNPGPGGYGIVMEDVDSNYFKEFSCGFRLTTNNRMELMAVIEALKKIKNDEIMKCCSSSNIEMLKCCDVEDAQAWQTAPELF